MTRYLLRRVLGAVPTLLVLSFGTFMLVRVIPGDPITALLDKTQDPQLAASLRRHYGLDQPLLTQYLVWLQGVLTGSFGRSFQSGLPVAELVAERLPRSLWLMAGGILVALLLAVPAGIVSAARRNRWPDLLASSVVTLLMAVPTFWLGILYIGLFAVTLHWLPATGYVDPLVEPLPFLSHIVLPWLTLGGTIAALTARLLRASLIEVLSHEYVLTARAKGLHSTAVLFGHALRNAAIPTVTLVGLEMGYLLGGAVVTERVFAYPGMGQFLLESILTRDYPVIQAGLLFFATAFVLMNLLTDLAVAAIDPRIRLG
jgi:peptide/nickel transport system permease protein